MKKIMKYIVTSSVFIIGSFSINEHKANAGMKNRIVTAFRSLNCFRCLKGEPLNKNIKAKVPKGLTHQANELYGRNIISGVGIDDFDTSNVTPINSNNWYLQRVNSKGDKVTIVSKDRPEIFGIVNDTVHQTYIKNNGEEVTVFHKGIPNWIPGNDLKNKIKMQKRSSNKNRQNVTGIDNLGFTDFDSNTLPNQNLTSKRTSSKGSSSSVVSTQSGQSQEGRQAISRRGSDLGATSNNFDVTELSEVNPDHLYHQHKSGDGRTVTMVSNGSSKDHDELGILRKTGTGNQAITEFKKLRWVTGKDLIERQDGDN